MPHIKFETCDHCNGTTILKSGRKCSRCENGIQAKEYLTCLHCGDSIRNKTLAKTLHIMLGKGCRLTNLV